MIEDRAEYSAGLPPEYLAERERAVLPVQVFINPTLTPVGDGQVTFVEGCLSVLGFAALVPRFREVEVRAFDVDGKEFTVRMRGWPARILQHETDHLNGMLYIDRMHSRSFGTNAQVQARSGHKTSVELLREFGITPP